MRGKFFSWVFRHRKYLLFGLGIFLFLCAGTVSAYFGFRNNPTFQKLFGLKTATNITQQASKSSQPALPAPNPSAAKDQIKANPPKIKTSGKISGSTKKNSDGSSTTYVGEGGVSASEADGIRQAGPSGSSPYQINFRDETGQYGGLEGPLKDFLNSSLKWDGEVSALYQIIIKDAGDTGWAGLYSGTYTTNPQGKIVSAYGWITLNVYYYKSSPYFVDYERLVLSHEYGHHYTLYHKWMDLNLPAGTRFPDSYYSVRPLSKSSTAPDYSKGWSNCDAEVIAEDYSYFWSGYGYHAMASIHGLPSGATKSWISNIASASVSQPAVDNPPAVSITEPANGSTLSGSVAFKANASDDIGVVKVVFYINSSVIFEDSSAPYETTLNTTAYSNGGYTLKAVAYDSKQSTQSSISVTFNNASVDTQKPVVT
ncbi:MAG: Ig-like domain-containing protein, partial [Candidatus Berkelbacteria bacterium]|nr:Ig-like domain-containing protein [Candidatus Berkelbacteria bacterium]